MSLSQVNNDFFGKLHVKKVFMVHLTPVSILLNPVQ